MIDTDALKLIELVLQFAILPIAYFIYGVSKDIHQLRLDMMTNFVSKQDLPIFIAGINHGKTEKEIS